MIRHGWIAVCAMVMLFGLAIPASADISWYAQPQVTKPTEPIYNVGSGGLAFIDFESQHVSGFTGANPNQFMGTILITNQLGWDDNGPFHSLKGELVQYKNVSANMLGEWQSGMSIMQKDAVEFTVGDYNAVAKSSIEFDGVTQASQTVSQPFLVR
jgi:hypothetical protein